MDISLILITCDRCNVEASLYKPYFFGTREEAQNHGRWEERDYGDICPGCVLEEAELDIGDTASGLEDMTNSMLKGAK